jgi:hypothetical protein
MKVQSKAFAVLTALAVPIAVSMSQLAHARGGHTLFITSAVENSNGTVTLPLYRGTSRGRTVYYVMLDASDGNFAQQFGLNTSQKLANAAGSAGVQTVSIIDGVVDFPATVDFSPIRQVTPGPEGFPPAVAQPGAVGETGYSPLIQMPDGVIVNAPHLVNNTGSADKVVNVDLINGKVVYRETNAFQGGDPIKYISTESSSPVAAALENATFAPALDALPALGDDSTASSRGPLAGFVNGQTGATNPQRQGINSAILDGLDPLQVVRWNPSQGRYSPMWDVHLTRWSDQIVAAGQNVRQTDYGTVENLAQQGTVTAPDGSPFAASGFIVNCPIVSLR